MNEGLGHNKWTLGIKEFNNMLGIFIICQLMIPLIYEEEKNRREKRKQTAIRIGWYFFASLLIFVAIFIAIMLESRAYAAPIPEIHMGTFQTEYVGEDPDEIAQMPETGDEITTPRTVVIRGSKWKLKPGFQLQSAKSTDDRSVSVAQKKRKAVIRAKEVGTADITLTGINGETTTYQIIVEDPQVKSLKITDFERLEESRYITGTRYLKPTSVSCSRPKIAQTYKKANGENVLNVFGSGRARVIVRYGEYRRKGRLKAKLPYMVSKDVKLKNKRKRIRIKNAPKDWTPTYRSTDPNVAICDSAGYVTPKGNGICTIYTKIGNTYLICHVTVEGFKK